MDGQHWQGDTYGNRWMHNSLIAMLRHIDVRLIYAFAAVFVVPVCLMAKRRNAACIYRYLRQRIGMGPMVAAWHTYVNHCLFSQVVIDRFAMYAGKKFRVNVVGYDHYLALASKGYVQLSAHVGNYELAGYTLVAEDKPFNALVYAGEKTTVMANRDRLFGKSNIRMIPIMADGSHVFALNEALANHEIVSMPADRVIGSPKVIAHDFLGQEARFPLGPFATATMRGTDVLAVNVMKTSAKGYTIYVDPLSYDKSAPRKQQIRELSAAYVTCLECVLRKHPAQWYNYFDFWK